MSAYEYLLGLLTTLEAQLEALQKDGAEYSLDTSDYAYHYKAMQAATVARLLVVDPVRYLAAETVKMLDYMGHSRSTVSRQACQHAFGLAVCDMNGNVWEHSEAVMDRVQGDWTPAQYRK